MSTIDHVASVQDGGQKVPDASSMRFGIVVSEWYDDITGALCEGARRALMAHGAKDENIHVEHVPGSFELIFGTSQMVKNAQVDAVIALGVVIRGETPHFDYICAGVTQELARLNADYDIPVIYGLLTTNNKEQAVERSGGKLGNKGEECGIDAIKMVEIFGRLKK